MRLFAGKRDQATALPYRLRDGFLSPAELSFFLVLREAVGERYVICPKPSLAEVLYVVGGRGTQAAHNRIANKRVDFLLCTPETMRPVLALELDDASHQRTRRRERDEIVDRAFEAAGLPLEHIQAKRAYSPAELARTVAAAVRPAPRSEEPARGEAGEAAVGSDRAAPAPLCPKCGVPMVLRTARRGAHAGAGFYGCRNYPRCNETKPAA